MKRISTLTLHRYRLGELSAAEAAEVRAHLDAVPEDRARLDSQEAQRRAFVLEPVPPALRGLGAARPAPWWRLPMLGLATSLALLLLFPRNLPTGESTRSKGEPALSVLVEGRGAWTPGERLHAGDRVQLQAPAGPWVEAWVTDGTGVLGRFDLRGSEPTLAPFSLTLDGAPGDETLVVLLAREPLSSAEATAALKRPDPSRVLALRLTLPKGP